MMHLDLVLEDMVLVKVDPEVSQRLMTGRYEGEESKKDIHERNVAYLERSAAAAAYCSSKLGWTVVDCARDGQMRSVEEIGDKIRKIICSIE